MFSKFVKSVYVTLFLAFIFFTLERNSLGQVISGYLFIYWFASTKRSSNFNTVYWVNILFGLWSSLGLIIFGLFVGSHRSSDNVASYYLIGAIIAFVLMKIFVNEKNTFEVFEKNNIIIDDPNNMKEIDEAWNELKVIHGCFMSDKELEREIKKKIKNRDKKTKSIIKDEKDLSYWFDLKQKGAISEEEYEQKKKEFL